MLQHSSILPLLILQQKSDLSIHICGVPIWLLECTLLNIHKLTSLQIIKYVKHAENADVVIHRHEEVIVRLARTRFKVPMSRCLCNIICDILIGGLEQETHRRRDI